MTITRYPIAPMQGGDGEGGAVDSVNGQTGAVELDAADVGAQPADTDLAVIAGLTHANDTILQTKAGVWTARTPAQVKTDLALAKGDVGLSTVDNTSDANKPVTTAQRAALAAEDDGLPGILGPTMRHWNVGTGAALTSGRLYAYRIYPRRSYSITSAWLDVSTASGTDDPLEIAIYNIGFTSKLATSGSVTGYLNSTGGKVVPLAVTLTAGTPYWVAFTATSTATVRQAQMNSNAMAAAFGTTPSTYLAMQKDGQSIPLPGSISAFGASNSVPVLCLREI